MGGSRRSTQNPGLKSGVFPKPGQTLEEGLPACSQQAQDLRLLSGYTQAPCRPTWGPGSGGPASPVPA